MTSAQDNPSTPQDSPPIHQDNSPIHENESICRFILKDATALPGSLAIKESPLRDAGSGLFTTRDVAEGELVFGSWPLINCAETLPTSDVCDFCFEARRDVLHPDGRFLNPAETLRAPTFCSGCKVYRYCTFTCKRAAWDAYHQHECHLLANAPTEVETRTLYRLLIKIKHGMLSKEQMEALFELQNHRERFRRGEGALEETILKVAVEAKARTESELDIADVEKLYCMLRINCTSIEPTYKNIGLGTSLDLVLSLVNHSCDPNVVVIFNDGKIEARALEPLRAGDEILNTYRDVAFDLMFRQPRIRSRYLFLCECNRCEMDFERHKDAVSGEYSRFKAIQEAEMKFLELTAQGMTQSIQRPGGANVVHLVRRLDTMMEHGYLGSRWPNDLEPLPTTWKTLASLGQANGPSLDSLKMRIKGTAWTKYRKGLVWVEDLLDLAHTLEAMVLLPPQHAVFRNAKGLPRGKDMRDVFIGHLGVLLVQTEKTHGAGATLTRAVRKWLDDEVRNQSGPLPNTRAFRKRFKAAHATLLKWAGVDGKLWVVCE